MSEIKMKDIKDHKEYKMIPYNVTRTVLELKELSKYAGYKRHKDTRKKYLLKEIFRSQNFHRFSDFQPAKVFMIASKTLA